MRGDDERKQSQHKKVVEEEIKTREEVETHALQLIAQHLQHMSSLPALTSTIAMLP